MPEKDKGQMCPECFMWHGNHRAWCKRGGGKARRIARRYA